MRDMIRAIEGLPKMSEDQNTHLIGLMKNLIRDQGMPRSIGEITDRDFRNLAASHADEFDEARGECEAELTLTLV
jgi:uncharacterized protein (UPF0147 family)